jgi:hypothetical protein
MCERRFPVKSLSVGKAPLPRTGAFLPVRAAEKPEPTITVRQCNARFKSPPEINYLDTLMLPSMMNLISEAFPSAVFNFLDKHGNHPPGIIQGIRKQSKYYRSPGNDCRQLQGKRGCKDQGQTATSSGRSSCHRVQGRVPCPISPELPSKTPQVTTQLTLPD